MTKQLLFESDPSAFELDVAESGELQVGDRSGSRRRSRTGT
jgi:hypothetical protein